MGRDREPAGGAEPPDGPGQRSPALEVAATVLLGALAGCWAWWGLEHGAYFGRVLYPGLLTVCLLLLALVASAPWRLALGPRSPLAIALAALAALAGWSALSATWSPSPDIAVMDGQRILGYATLALLAAWTASLLGPRIELSSLPIAAAALAVGLVTALRLLAAGDPAGLLEADGTLDSPLGYRNANAAFFLIALWPALALASSPRIAGPIRVAAVGAGSLFIGLGMLSQSRGALVGGAVALAVYLVAAPRKLPALAWLVAAAAPALVCLDAAAGLYEVGPQEVAGAMRAAGRSLLVAAALGCAAGSLTLFLGRFVPAPEAPAWSRRRGPRAAIALTLAAAAVATAFLATGNPARWVGDRLEEFQAGGQPDLTQETSRFTLNAGSNRSDLWRVALNAVEEHPLRGDGGGGYQYRYLRERTESLQLARDAHNVSLEVASELGLVGWSLFACAGLALAVGAARARRHGPEAAALSGAALTAGAYWLAHASLDWFWPYPALSAPVIALLAAACVPAALAARPRRPGRAARWGLGLALVAFAATLVPPFLSDSYLDRAYQDFRRDPALAYRELDRARRFNPLSDAPWLAEGAIARELGDRRRAIAAFAEAARKRPEEWAPHYYLALLYARDDPRRARQAIAAVADRNPLAPELETLRARLRGR